jgi:riboflavin kinase / FMN adenylyltransferase
MQLVRHIEDIPFDKKSVVTIGTFDGVHLAHQKILHTVRDGAKKLGGRSVVVTFEPHPREVLSTTGTQMMLLTSLQERQDICDRLGIQWLVVIGFDIKISQLHFRDFFFQYLINGIGIHSIIEGYDHHWGKNREGNIDALVLLGKQYAFDVIRMEQFTYEGTPVSSSIIRDDLVQGNLERANTFLGRAYSLSGKVVEGDRRGRSLGYPTVNIEPSILRKVIPKDGIYFVQVHIAAARYFGMASIGVRPTFKTDGKRTIEVNILDFDKDIYGYDLRIDFLRRLRDEIKFQSADELVRQMQKDEEVSRILQVEFKTIS